MEGVGLSVKNEGRGVKGGRYYKFVLERRMKCRGQKGGGLKYICLRVQSYPFGN